MKLAIILSQIQLLQGQLKCHVLQPKTGYCKKKICKNNVKIYLKSKQVSSIILKFLL